MPKFRSPLTTTVFSTKWDWYEILEFLPERQKKKFLNLPKEEQQKIIDDFNYSIGKGMKSGVLHEWHIIMQSAIEDSGLIEYLRQEVKP